MTAAETDMGALPGWSRSSRHSQQPLHGQTHCIIIWLRCVRLAGQAKLRKRFLVFVLAARRAVLLWVGAPVPGGRKHGHPHPLRGRRPETPKTDVVWLITRRQYVGSTDR